jgi:DNA-binding NarL/FixJ family response regulator
MKQSRRIEVVIASRYLMYAHTFASLVEQEEQYKVTCMTDSAKTLKSYLKENSPSILITDIRLKDSDAYTYLKQVQKRGLNILFVTDKLETYAISYVLKYGAKSIVSLY